MLGYIYYITNKVNKKQYIGETINFEERKAKHLAALRSNKHHSIKLQRAYNKYGEENFKKEIIGICNSYEEMNEAEKKWIKYYNAVLSDEFYNIAEGGFNSNPCAGLDKEAEKNRRKKLSDAAKGEKNHFYGKHFKKEEHPFYGKHHSESAKKKMSDAKKGGNSPTAKGVDIYTPEGKFIKHFDTQRDFKIFLGLSPNGSTDTLKKHIIQQKIYHGYIVKYSN